MPHFTCMPCKLRLQRSSADVALGDEWCPNCGQPLQPAVELTELVGLRFASPYAPPIGTSHDAHRRLAESVAQALPVSDAPPE